MTDLTVARLRYRLRTGHWTVGELARALDLSEAGIHTALYRLRKTGTVVRHEPAARPAAVRTGRRRRVYWISEPGRTA